MKRVGGIQCGCLSLILLVSLLFGGWSVNYLLVFLVGKSIPMIGAMVIGVVAGTITIPAAIVLAILRWYGIL